MGSTDDLKPILEILLAAIAEERGVTQEYLSVEIEQVALKALMEAYKLGDRKAHDRPTLIPRRPATDPLFVPPKKKA